MDTFETATAARSHARDEELTTDSPEPGGTTEETASPEPARHSLAFILDEETQVEAVPSALVPLRSLWSLSPPLPHVEDPRDDSQTHPQAATAAGTSLPVTQGSTTRRSREDRRKARGCTVAGCSNYTIDRGVCFRHGGGKQCSIDGCCTSAKHRGLCWKHGGSTGCTVDGCTRGAKSKGLCWSHGGANKCTTGGCVKMTISKGLCWTHGGGKRCLFDGCKRPASKKNLNFCAQHGAEVSQVDYVFEV